MLSYEVMGVLGLAIIWVNALLVGGAALKELAALRAWSAAAAGGMLRGTVVRGAGPGGAIAANRVEQIGRATDGGEVLFGDRSHASEVFGGVVRLGDGREVEIGPVAAAVASPIELRDGAVEVWPDARAVAEAAACPSIARFEEALEVGRKARGFARTVEVSLGAGAEVFVIGDVRGGSAAELAGPPRLIATIDPRAWARGKTWLVIGFTAAELAAAAASTAVAVWPPAFGLVSKLGGALCLAFFLGVQPLGTAVRDAVRSPARHLLRGRWARPVTERAQGTAAAS